MRKRLFAGLLMLLLIAVGASTWPEAVGANEDNPYGYLYSQREITEYRAAIENCETPSLECLVRHVVRFTAIELSNEIAGEDHELGGAGNEITPGSDAGTGGAIGGLFSLMGAMFSNPPANTGSYIADLSNNMGLASPAYAQGLGFASLEPILDLWKAFRNIAYFFFILFFIVIGFMIMFRYKIGGQTAISAQQAIPSVIISLILVTFSYAIAGFMIDLMYLTMLLMIGLFTGLIDLSQTFGGNMSLQSVLNMNIFQIGSSLFGTIWRGIGETTNLINSIVNAAIASTTAATIAGMIGGLTVTLVLSVAVLIGVFKLFFELLKSYFSIIVSVVLAPIILMIGALPGRNVFWPWLTDIIGNLAAFPAVLLVLIMFVHFTGGGISNVQGGFIPPFLFGAGQSGMIGPLLGLATILALPELVKKIKEVLGAKDGFGSMIAAAAWSRAREGAPTALMAGGLVTGPAIGAAVAAPAAWWETRGQQGLQRIWSGSQTIGRGMANTTYNAARFGRTAGEQMGGQTPGGLGLLVRAVEGGTKSLTDEERLRRLAERTNLLGRRTAQDRRSYPYRRELAEQQAAKQAWEEERLRQGQFGTPTERV